MGVQRDGFYDHEGYPVAYVEREGCGEGSGIFRELGYPDKGEYSSGAIVRLGAACSCGWRSMVFMPRIGEKPPEWMPCSVMLSHYDDELVHRLWDRHIANDCTADTKPHAESQMRLPFDWREKHVDDDCRECVEYYGLTVLRAKQKAVR